ncbi:glycine cleavage system protein GcvH [Pseudonocardia spinosispora]|uniref:glycine cleavage system protein GcvH n=1 Tax=Pseudonocardia spinosispora TaxID=103441 RepID=UPI00048D8EAC|nr:glycine cleavage system protein GcvH [Pseudonocardia spinosispora]
MIPEDLRYTDAHEWVRVTADDVVRVGITDYAQRQLGDVVFVELPEVGQRIVVGVAVGEVESTKSVSELFAPLSGEVVAANEALADQPELVNAEPYGVGWMFELRLDEPVEQSLEGLLDASGYRSLTDQS